MAWTAQETEDWHTAVVEVATVMGLTQLEVARAVDLHGASLARIKIERSKKEDQLKQ